MSPQTDLDSSILGRGMIGFVRKSSRSFVKRNGWYIFVHRSVKFFHEQGCVEQFIDFNIDKNIYSSVLFYTFLF